MAKCDHLDPENLYHFLSVTNLNVGGMGSIPRTQVCSRLQEEEFAPGAGAGVQAVSQAGRAGLGPFPASWMSSPIREVSPGIRDGRGFQILILSVKSAQTIACYHFIQEKEFHIFLKKGVTIKHSNSKPGKAAGLHTRVI